MIVPHQGQRSTAVAGPPTRQVNVRAASLNDDARTFVAVVASEKPVLTIDFRTGNLVDEILVATGGEFPGSVPLLDSHQRGSTSDVIGSMNQFRREQTNWVGHGAVAFNDARADSVWSKIRDGHLTSLSIGYTIQEFVTVRSGTTEVVNGWSFTATKDRDLRVVTKWRVHEVSVVAIPADSSAKIRAAVQPTIRSSTTMPVPTIHSRQSVTGQPSFGALVSAQQLRCGINDPSQNRVAFQDNRLIRLSGGEQFERDADEGQRLATGHIIDTMKHLAALDGIKLDPDGGHRGVLHQCWEGCCQRSSVSTANVTAFFTQIFGALFLAGWDAEEDTTAGWTSENDSLSLRQTPRGRPGAMEPLRKRGRGGTAEDVTFETPSEDTQLGEYSGKFNIDEMDLINNQFGNFEQLMPQQMGAAAKRLRPDLVYSQLLANGNMRDGKALFHADHANLQTGAALIEATLSDAQSLIAKQAEGGVPLNLRGRYIVVPQKLERTAAKLAREVELADGESTPPPVVRSDSRLDNGVVDPATGTKHNGSDTTWFASAAGNNHTIELQYLKGTGRQPRIRFGFLREGQFGVWFDVQHFIAAKAIDWRGLVKSEA